MDDITPELLQTISNEFDEIFGKDDLIKTYLKKLKVGQPNYVDANEFAVRVGQILSKVLQSNINSGVLPDGKMYFNIANRILNNVMKKNYNIVSKYSVEVQKGLNNRANIHLKVKKPKVNQDRIDGIVNRLSSEAVYDDVKWILDDPVVNFTQSVVDDLIDTNIKFHAEVGLHPKVTRTIVGNACKYCKNLAGTYQYPEDVSFDMYHRHENCRCMVVYDPGDGKKQDVWTKKFS